MRSALVLVEGGVGSRRSGPAIRGLEMGKALSSRLAVTVAVEESAAANDPGVRVVDRSLGRLLRELRRHDAVIAPWVPAYVLAGLPPRRPMAIADLYDPVDVEAAMVQERVVRRWEQTARRARRMQLRFADLIVCASERQREGIASELDGLLASRAERPRVLVVPFGLGPDPPPPTRRPLRQAFPRIGPDDPVVLWWGSIWRWMDAETAIRAVARLAEHGSGVRLVFTAGRPPSPHVAPFVAVDEARALARSLGLLGRSVFFLEDWIPYEDRHEYLLEADVGLNLHLDPHEAELSARARHMDYLWAGLPCVVSQGGELAEHFGRAGFAKLVPLREVAVTAEAIESLATDAAARARARAAARGLANAYRWETVVEPLADAVEQGARRRVRRAAAAAHAAAYYARRLADRVYERLA